MDSKKVWMLGIGLLFSFLIFLPMVNAANINWTRSFNSTGLLDQAYSTCVDSNFVYIAGREQDNIQGRIEKRYKLNGTTVTNYTSNPSGSSDNILDCVIANNGTQNYLYTAMDQAGATIFRIEQIDPTTMTNVRNYSVDITGGTDFASTLASDGTFLYAGGSASGDWHITRLYLANLSNPTNYTSNAGGTDELHSMFYDQNVLWLGGTGNAIWRVEKINTSSMLNLANATLTTSTHAYSVYFSNSTDRLYVSGNGTIRTYFSNLTAEYTFNVTGENARIVASGSKIVSIGRASSSPNQINITTYDSTFEQVSQLQIANASIQTFGKMTLETNVLYIGYIGNPTTDANFSSIRIDNIPSAMVLIKVFNERNTSQRIQFDLVLNNGTCEFTRNNIDLFVSEFNDSVCTNRTTITISNDSDGGFTWPARNTIATITNGTDQTINAYLLRDDAGLSHAFIVTTFTDVPIENATVEIRRLIGSTYTPVASCLTDTSGSCTHFMDPTITYQVVVTADGYQTATFTKQASAISTQTFVKLRSTGVGDNILNLTTAFEGISYSITPASGIQNSTFNITFFISASNGDLSWFALNVTYRNITNRSIPFSFTNESTSPSGGTIIVTVNATTNRTGWYDANATFRLTNQSFVTIPIKSYFLTNGTGTAGFDPFTGAYDLNSYQLVGLFILGISTAFFARFGFFAGMVGGLGVQAMLTFGFPIFPWEWFALTFLLIISGFMLTRRL